MKSGYMNVQYGQTRPFESGKPIELADKQAMDDVVIAMPRGGAISGRVVDEFGDPLSDANVSAARLSWTNGKRRLTPVPGRSWPTDDLGRYRIFGLPPGEYYVTATLRNGNSEMMADLPMMLTGVEPPAGAPGSVPRSGYAVTYFPGTPNASEAQRVTVTAAQESSNVDFPLSAVRLAKISGFVMTSEGKPAGGTILSLSPATREVVIGLETSSARTAQDGSFTINNVTPGDYLLRAEAIQVTTATQGDGNAMVFRAVRIGGEGGEQESGSMTLGVSGEDLSNITLITTKGGSATGRVVFDGEPKPPMTGIRLMSSPLDLGAPNGAFGGASVKEDGTFELKGLFGARMILVNGPPAWRLRSVKLNGSDITDIGADFKAGETYNLEVELTRKTTTIAGGVTASDGAPVKDYTVVVFSENPDLWRLARTRWVSGTRPDQDGRFKVSNMPAGAYYAVAVEYIPTGEWGDPELLDRLKSHAKRFSLDEGSSQTLDLKLTDKY